MLSIHRCPPAVLATALLALVIQVLFPARPARAQDSWTAGPGHLSVGNSNPFSASTIWDPDGAGPLPMTLVAARSGLGYVMVWIEGAWIQYGNQFDGNIEALAVFDGQLYVGGNFPKIGSVPINSVARWTGHTWEALGSGLTGTPSMPTGYVHTLEAFGGMLFIGGSFIPVATGVRTHCIAWNGAALVTAFSPNTPIEDFTVYGSHLYCGTDHIGSSGGVYRYDPTKWTRLGIQPFGDDGADTGHVFAVIGFGGDLIAAGSFGNYGPPNTNLIARWDGTSWVAMGTGAPPDFTSPHVTALTVYGGVLYAAGHFSLMGDQRTFNIARWDGTAWSPCTQGIDTRSALGVQGMIGYDGDLIVLGAFDRAGVWSSPNIARWNGSEWSPWVDGINGSVRAFLPLGSALYAGGDFDFTSIGIPYHHVVGSDGTSLAQLDAAGGFDGTNGTVNAMTTHVFGAFQPARLVAGGEFISAGGVAAANVAAYNLLTHSWAQVGAGFNGPVLALANWNGSLWAAGYFTTSGANALSHLAAYSSGSWVSPGAWPFTNIFSLATYAGALIIGGLPDGSWGVSAWNGTAMQGYGASDGPVMALTTFNGQLIAAGSFTTMDGQPVSDVARRDPSDGRWYAMGAGLSNGAVYALTVFGGNLYAGGSFTSSGSATVHRIARWTGADWEEVLGGLDDHVFALASFGGALHVGGAFHHGAGDVSPHWIVYHDGVVAVEPQSAPVRELRFVSAGTLRSPVVALDLPTPASVSVCLYDVTGRRALVLARGPLAAGRHELAVPAREVASGVYFGRAVVTDPSGTRALTTRVVLTR